MSDHVLNTLLSRRSVLARDLTAPGPSSDQLQQILEAAHRVPDHGKIGPWRFVVFEGDARQQFSERLGEIFREDHPDTTEKCIDFERTRLMRAPLVIGVISAAIEHKVPQWEQVLCAGAVCQNILLAARALGFGSQWLTEWYAYHAKVDAALGLTDNEKVAGFMYIGSHAEPPKERVRPALEDRITHWAP